MKKINIILIFTIVLIIILGIIFYVITNYNLYVGTIQKIYDDKNILFSIKSISGYSLTEKEYKYLFDENGNQIDIQKVNEKDKVYFNYNDENYDDEQFYQEPIEAIVDKKDTNNIHLTLYKPKYYTCEIENVLILNKYFGVANMSSLEVEDKICIISKIPKSRPDLGYEIEPITNVKLVKILDKNVD